MKIRIGTAIHREAGRSPRREAAPVAVRAANYVDVITNRKPLSRGAFCFGEYSSLKVVDHV